MKSIQQIKVNTCPFHPGGGCEVGVSVWDCGGKETWYRVEADCGARGPESQIRNDAIAEWNQAGQPPAPEAGSK